MKSLWILFERFKGKDEMMPAGKNSFCGQSTEVLRRGEGFWEQLIVLTGRAAAVMTVYRLSELSVWFWNLLFDLGQV